MKRKNVLEILKNLSKFIDKGSVMGIYTDEELKEIEEIERDLYEVYQEIELKQKFFL
jgi:hypothetical protein